MKVWQHSVMWWREICLDADKKSLISSAKRGPCYESCRPSREFALEVWRKYFIFVHQVCGISVCNESYVLFPKNFFLGVVAVRLIWFLRLWYRDRNVSCECLTSSWNLWVTQGLSLTSYRARLGCDHINALYKFTIITIITITCEGIPGRIWQHTLPV